MCIEELPDWANQKNMHNLVRPMAQLCTKDGRIVGNATVVEVYAKDGKPYVTVVTEAGNVIPDYLLSELHSRYHIGDYIQKQLPTQEGREAYERFLAETHSHHP